MPGFIRSPLSITHLAHEAGDDPVEDGSGVAVPLLACAQRLEVGGRLGHNVAVESELNPTKGFITGRDVEVDRVGDGSGIRPTTAPAENVGEDVQVGRVEPGGGRNDVMAARRDHRATTRHRTVRR